MSADSATAPDGEWLELFRIILPSDKTFPVKFEQMLPGGARNLVGVRAVGKAGDLGERSNLAAVITTVAPVIYAINVPSGVSGEVVLFGAVVTGTHPRFYEWNFGGGAEPNVTNDPLPNVTLGAIGWYDGRLTVTNEYGTAIRDFKYYVPGQPLQPPVAIAQAWPLGGDAPLEVTFLSNLSYSPNGAIVKYEWDFESDGTYDWENDSPLNAVHTFAGGMWKATLRVTDEAGQVGTAETELLTVYPIGTWTIKKVVPGPSQSTIPGGVMLNGIAEFPPKQIAFFFPGPNPLNTCYAYLSQQGDWRVLKADARPHGGEFQYTKPAGFRNDGTAIYYSTNESSLFGLTIGGTIELLQYPSVPGHVSTIILFAKMGKLDEIYTLATAKPSLADLDSLFYAEYDGQNWTYDPVPIPNTKVIDLLVADGTVACISYGDSIWLSIRDGGEWQNRLVALPPKLMTFRNAYLFKVQGKLAVVASYANEPGATSPDVSGILFYLEQDGYFSKTEILPPDDPAGAIYRFSACANDNNVAVAVWIEQTRTLRIKLYDGSGWSEETLTYSLLESIHLGGIQWEPVSRLRSLIGSDGRLNLIFGGDLTTGEKITLHASRMLN